MLCGPALHSDNDLQCATGRIAKAPFQETFVSVQLSLTVNGKAVQASVDPRTLLVQLLREHLQLTGTHVGCDTAQCGACTVHLNGRAVKSCSMLAVQAQGAQITTIEGLATAASCTRCRPRSASATACNAASAPPAW